MHGTPAALAASRHIERASSNVNVKEPLSSRAAAPSAADKSSAPQVRPARRGFTLVAKSPSASTDCAVSVAIARSLIAPQETPASRSSCDKCRATSATSRAHSHAPTKLARSDPRASAEARTLASVPVAGAAARLNLPDRGSQHRLRSSPPSPASLRCRPARRARNGWLLPQSCARLLHHERGATAGSDLFAALIKCALLERHDA